ncbi:hypothetical protein B1A99_33645 [Cohnella sp. CIP 111063]|nr:hypothetical protein B1A99_33645 [Cohnella sp. CIP 111063]
MHLFLQTAVRFGMQFGLDCNRKPRKQQHYIRQRIPNFVPFLKHFLLALGIFQQLKTVFPLGLVIKTFSLHRRLQMQDKIIDD